MSNLPIFRAKKIYSDEYVVGFYVDTVDFLTKTLKNTNGYITKNGSFHIVDISTLSIHFPDIIDSQGNKIFASLQEDGKGGDILALEDIKKTAIWCSKTQAIMLSSKQTGLSHLSLYKDDIKIIGIQ